MSNNISTYIGVFIKIPNKVIKIPKITYKTIEGLSTDFKFNPYTGEANIEEVTHLVTIQYGNSFINNVEGLDGDMFFSPSFHFNSEKFTLAIPNRLCENEIQCISLEGYNTHSLLNVDPVSAIDEFKTKYETYIDYYTKKFGEITIDYGIITFEV